MQHNYTSRVILIIAILVLALIGVPFLGDGIFSAKALFDPSAPWSRKLNLRAGTDIAGGTTLLYAIQTNGNPEPGLAEAVAAAIRKRIDPNGLKNYIIRAQGNDKIEIQMSLAADAGKGKAAQEAFLAAQARLAALNIRQADIDAMLAEKDPAKRSAAAVKLAGKSAERLKLLQDLNKADLEAKASDTEHMDPAVLKTKTQAEINALNDRYISRQAEAKALYTKLAESNLSVNGLSTTLEETQAKIEKEQNETERNNLAKDLKAKEEEWRATAGDDPERLAAVNAFLSAWDNYNALRGTMNDAEDLKRLLKGSGVLEFHIAVNPTEPEYSVMRDRLLKGDVQPHPGDTMRWYKIDDPQQFKRDASIVDYNNSSWMLLWTTRDKSMVHDKETRAWGLTHAGSQYNAGTGTKEITFTFDPAGGSLFGELSGTNIKGTLAILLDDKVISAPTLQSRIFEQGSITGSFTDAQIQYLVQTLSAGSLPASLASEPISERTISPAVGGDNLRMAFYSCVAGLCVMAFFLIGYYYIAGVIATFAVLMNMVVILGVLAWFGATFTLPGIAGLVLTIGTAVDANVLIFERLREEQHRGLSLRLAVHNAYDRAFTAILDSNVITVITSLILYAFGSEEVKGFALTLLIGILSSLFAALFVTRTIFGLLIDKGHIKKLSSFPLTFPKWDKFLRPNVDWMSKVWIFICISALIIVVGAVAYVTQGRNMYSIEFVSGTAVDVKLKQPMPIQEVRDQLGSAAYEPRLPNVTVTAVVSTTAGTEYEITTPNQNGNEVKEAVTSALAGKLDVEPQVDFDGENAGANADAASEAQRRDAMFNAAMNSYVFPVDGDLVAKAKLPREPAKALDFRGGAAIVLKGLKPALSANQIRERLDRARLQLEGGSKYYTSAIDTFQGDDNAPSDTAVVMVSSSTVHYDAKDSSSWRVQLVRPAWDNTYDGLRKPPQLGKVNNIGAQVAGDTATAAGMALGVSIFLVMIYIWLRFGNFKYGSATVIAMLHDVLLVVGCIGLSHIIYQHIPGLAKALLLEPFRIDLTMVAAVLTVMGYSMVDTIVVFDRIRENRGRYGHLNRQLVNDSINQTLSRTLLTAGTTMVILLVMYLFGGSGFHGFTFALFIGILVGTYSSIAIAAPLLLTGRPETAPMTPAKPVSKLSGVGHP